MKFRIYCFLTASLIFVNSALFGAINVAIIYNDVDIGALRNGLLAYHDFGQIYLISWSSTPSLARISGYDSVIVTQRYKPISTAYAWSNIVADYAEAGGGVVLGFGFFGTDGPSVNYGRLEDASHSPFTRGAIVAGNDSLGSILIPSHPLMAGVNQLTTEYRYNVTANPGAHVAASFASGVPLAGYIDVGQGRVVGIQAHYTTDPFLVNNGDYMQLYRDAAVYSVIPEPATILLLGLGGILLRARK